MTSYTKNSVYQKINNRKNSQYFLQNMGNKCIDEKDDTKNKKIESSLKLYKLKFVVIKAL